MSVQVAKQSSSTNAGAIAGHSFGAIPGIGLTSPYAGGPYTIGTHEFDEGIDIRITPASGGFIVSVNHRNHGTRPDLHIVTEDKDLGVEIGKIITISCLKKDNNK
jgi:hypothetical protein